MSSNSIKSVRYKLLDFTVDPGYRIGTDASIWSRKIRTCPGYGGGSKASLGDKWKKRKLQIHKGTGYYVVMLRRNGKKTLLAVHRLMLEAFVGPCQKGQQCRHLNGDKLDNRLDNLCWGTVKEDRQDMRRHGRLHFGISHHTAKMTDEDARRAIVLCEEKGLSRSKVAERFGVSPSSITQILHRWGRWKNL